MASDIEPDSTIKDSVRKYEVPQIISFSQTSSLDSALSQEIAVEPIFHLVGFQEFINFTPCLVKDKGDASYLIAAYPVQLILHSHSISSDYFEQSNLVSLPIPFFRSIKLSRQAGFENIHSLEFEPEVNSYDRPYSVLYFTALGNNTVYSLDFTRAVGQDLGFYLNGLYSQLYKMADSNYLRTSAGCANLYYNQFLPSRMDILFARSDYGTSSRITFSDISMATGVGIYRMVVHRTEESREYLDTLRDHLYVNNLTSYGANQRILFSFMNFENTVGFEARTSTFKYDTVGSYNNYDLILHQKVDYSISRLRAGVGYYLGYRFDDKMYASPGARVSYNVFSGSEVFGRLALYHRRADFVAKYGNGNFAQKEMEIVGNAGIQDESHFHKEIGFQIKNSSLSLYHMSVRNHTAYRRDSAEFYSASNINNNTIIGLEILVNLPMGKGFSLGTVSSYLINPGQFSVFPKENFNFMLSWTRKTERSTTNLIARCNYLGERSDVAGNTHVKVWMISPGVTTKFLTLALGMTLENALDQSASDFPNLRRRFDMEIKWEFWD